MKTAILLISEPHDIRVKCLSKPVLAGSCKKKKIRFDFLSTDLITKRPCIWICGYNSYQTPFNNLSLALKLYWILIPIPFCGSLNPKMFSVIEFLSGISTPFFNPFWQNGMTLVVPSLLPCNIHCWAVTSMYAAFFFSYFYFLSFYHHR